MSWTVDYDLEIGLVCARFVGIVTDDDFKAATVEAIGLAQANNTTRFLIDDSQWEGGASVVGLFELPALHETLSADRSSRAALILPPPDRTDNVKTARFYETVCQNRGWNVRVFQERQEAIEWLTQATPR